MCIPYIQIKTAEENISKKEHFNLTTDKSSIINEDAWVLRVQSALQLRTTNTLHKDTLPSVNISFVRLEQWGGVLDIATDGVLINNTIEGTVNSNADGKQIGIKSTMVAQMLNGWNRIEIRIYI